MSQTMKSSSRLTTASTKSEGKSRTSFSLPLRSPLGSKSSGRFTFFGRKRTSTSTSATFGSNGSFTLPPPEKDGPTVFQTFQNANHDDEAFEFSNVDGAIKPLPRPSDMTTRKDSDLRMTDALTPRVSELTKAKSPTGAPIFIGKASITDDTSSKGSSQPPTPTGSQQKGKSQHVAKSTMEEVPPSKQREPHHFKQSYQSRHKVPSVVKKLLEDEPVEFDWPSAPAYSMMEQSELNQDDDFDIPPPPPIPAGHW